MPHVDFCDLLIVWICLELYLILFWVICVKCFVMMISIQDMIENVLEIKDTHVREVMTPLIDVVAIDGSATLVDFHNLWVTHQYSRYIKFLG